MAVEKIDANVQGLISESKQRSQGISVKDDASDAARKKAEKKIAIKKARLKGAAVNKEEFSRGQQVDQKLQAVIGGQEGPEVADGMKAWNDNKQLQAKLTEAQKSLFREAMLKNPPKAAKSGKILDRLAQQPAFQKAVKTTAQMGAVHQAVIEDPGAGEHASTLASNRFMQTKKGDADAKNRFMRFGMDQAKKGNVDTVRKAGDMLGSLVKSGIGRRGQRAAMKMVERAPGDSKAVDNIDAFVKQPVVARLPRFARSRATELLSKAGGKAAVREGFQELASNPTFKTQTPQNKGRFFSTIGTGRPGEFRAITDKQLTALQGNDFPKSSGQVQKFLSKISDQVKQGGANNINVRNAIKAAKSSPMPTLKLVHTDDDMSDEEISQARSQNRANVMQFYNKLQRVYEQGEKQLQSAKYLEDVNALQNLREPDDIDLSSLSPDELAFVQKRSVSVRAKLGQVRKLQRQKARELRTRRMPMAKRRALAARRRTQGQQPKYFSPDVGKSKPTQAFLATGTDGRPQLPQTPQRGAMQQAQNRAGNRGTQRGGGLDIQAQVAQALAQAGGTLTPQTASRVAQTIAQSVAQQVAEQVTQQLMGAFAGEEGPAQPGLPRQKNQPAAKSQLPKTPYDGHTQSKQTKMPNAPSDGWGIPRNFAPDLGGTRRTPIRMASEAKNEAVENAHLSEPVQLDEYKGKLLIKDPSKIRELVDLFRSTWKGLSKPELALLKNLGWNQQRWDTKDTVAAKWPRAMMTPFASLSPLQREAVRKLGFEEHDWDKKIQAFSSGKNA